MIVMSTSFILVGLWITLQFKFVSLHYPAVAIACERLLVTASLPLVAIVHTMGLATLVNYSDIPYYLFVILSTLYYLLGRPLQSSFYLTSKTSTSIGGSTSKVATQDYTIQTRFDGFCMATLMTVLPGALYAAVHLPMMTHSVHLYSLALLVSLPAIIICVIPKGLWWLPGTPSVSRAIRNTILTVALLVFLVGFEGRVIFHSFSQYIKLQAPWDWLAITLALLGVLSVVMALVTDFISNIDVTLMGSVLLICTTAGGLAIGIPFQWLPAPLIAACGLALFNDSRNLREYIVFTGGAFLTGLWFIYHHFWFLDIYVGHNHLHTMCKLALAAFVPALLVPGMVFVRASKVAISALLVLQAVLVCSLEELLYVASQSDMDTEELMYPGYLVIATSALGILTARYISKPGLSYIYPSTSWALTCMYGAKLAILVLPEAFLLLPTTLLLLAASAPLYMYTPDPNKRRIRLQPWQGWLHVLSVVISAGLARFAIFDVVQFVLSARPSEGLLLGVLVMVLAVGCVPLVTTCYTHNPSAAKSVVLLGSVGLLLVLLQPPMPLQGGARCPHLPLSLCPRLWDERHVPLHSTEDLEVWAAGGARWQHWPRWLLLGAIIAGLGAALTGSGGRQPVKRRVFMALLSGGVVGMYIALEMVPGQPMLQGMVVLSCLMAVLYVALLAAPHVSSASATLLPVLGFSWAVVFVLTMLLQAELPPPDLPALHRLFPESRSQMEAERSASTRASLLGVFAAHSLLLAFTTKLKITNALRKQDQAATAGDSSGVLGYGPCLPQMDLCTILPSSLMSKFSKLLQLEGPGGVVLQRLSAEGLAWLPTLGNLFAINAFALGVALNSYITGGAPEAIFMLAPLLLLLSQDPVILPSLLNQQRYFPPVLVACAYLVVTAAMQISQSAAARFLPTQQPLAFIGWSALMASVTLPCQYLFLQYLWTFKVRPAFLLLVWAPLNLLPIVFCDILTVKYMAVLALVMAFTQFFSMRHVRHVGMKVI